jgi:hypothetical protein
VHHHTQLAFCFDEWSTVMYEDNKGETATGWGV